MKRKDSLTELIVEGLRRIREIPFWLDTENIIDSTFTYKHLWKAWCDLDKVDDIDKAVKKVRKQKFVKRKKCVNPDCAINKKKMENLFPYDKYECPRCYKKLVEIEYTQPVTQRQRQKAVLNRMGKFMGEEVPEGLDLTQEDFQKLRVIDEKEEKRYKVYKFIEPLRETTLTHLINDKLREFNPDYYLKGCASVYAFGGVLSLRGSPGLSIPVNVYTIMGVKRGKGEIKYYRIKEGLILTNPTLTSINRLIRIGRAMLSERYPEEIKKCISNLKKYDYIFILEEPPNVRFGLSGTCSAFLAMVALGKGIKWMQQRGRGGKKVRRLSWQVVNIQKLTEPLILQEFLQKQTPNLRENMRMLINLSIAIEDQIHTDNEGIDTVKGEEYGFMGFSSGGAPLSTIFGKPIKVALSKIKDEKMMLDLEGTMILPNAPKTNLIGLLRAGMTKYPTFQSLGILIDRLKVMEECGLSPSEFLDTLDCLNIYVVEKASEILLRLGEDIRSMKSFMSLMRLQQSIYKALSISTAGVDAFSTSMEQEFKVAVSMLGSGRGGLLLFSTEDERALKNFQEKLECVEEIGRKYGIVNHLGEKIFQATPLTVHSKI